jgi:hypothetical protein
MKSLLGLVLLAVIALVNSSVSHAQQNQSNPPLNNAAVVKLAKAGFKEKTIISIISARLPNFDLSPERMIELKHNGVSEKVIMAMLARQEGAEMSDDALTDDAFFNSGLDPKSSSNTNSPNSSPNSNPNDGSTDIFGNSSGTKSRTKTRGNGNGGLDSDTVTTGSATVRILRPPTEANGGSPAKLEKTKSLTNDSIVELVEAGFSEGTIIRRIEQSPVDFDLAAPKLEDLRKRRVSDKILSAMKSAMGDDSTK